MLQILKALFSSKKFLVMLAGILLASASKLGLDLDEDLVNQILAMVGAYVVGQGIADHGKEAAKTASKAGPALVLLVAILAASSGVASMGCGSSQREKTIHATYVTTNAAHESFVAFDRGRQQAIVDGAKSLAEGQAALLAYREKRARIVELFTGTYRALSAAAIVNDDPKSLDKLSQAAGLLVQALRDLTGGAL